MKKIIRIFLALCMGIINIHMTMIQAKEESTNTYQVVDYQAPSPTQNQDVPFVQNQSLPTRYDAREEGIITPVKDQGEFGICWAYSMISIAETQLIKSGYANSLINLSELQLAYGFYHRQNDPLGLSEGDYIKVHGDDPNAYLSLGGNHFMAAFYMNQWSSPQSENEFPNVNKYQHLADNYETLFSYDNTPYILKDAIFFDDRNINEIKKAVIEYGSVATAYYANDKKDNPYIFDNSNVDPNHGVTIVGYDDTISKEMFINSNANHQLPSQDGAWIIKNSWGNKVGDQGYYYMSYDNHLYSTMAITFEPRDKYDNNYFHDGGCFAHYGNPSGFSNLKMRVEYTPVDADINGVECLEAINLAIASSNTKYSIQIYHFDRPNSHTIHGTPVYEKPLEGYKYNAGIYTIDLPEPIILQKGETIEIIIELSKDKGVAQMFFSMSAQENNMTQYENIGNAQSSIYCKGFWYDQWIGAEESKVLPRVHAITKVYQQHPRIELGNKLNQITYPEEYDLLNEKEKAIYEDAIQKAQDTYNTYTSTTQDYIDAMTNIDQAYIQVEAIIDMIHHSYDTLNDKIIEIEQYQKENEYHYLNEEAKTKVSTLLLEAKQIYDENNQDIRLYMDTIYCLDDMIVEIKEIQDHAVQSKQKLQEQYQLLKEETQKASYDYLTDFLKNDLHSLLEDTKQMMDQYIPKAQYDQQYDLCFLKQDEVIKMIEEAKKQQQQLQEQITIYRNQSDQWDTSLLTDDEKIQYQNSMQESEEIANSITIQTTYASKLQQLNEIYDQTYKLLLERQNQVDPYLAQLRQTMISSFETYEQLLPKFYLYEDDDIQTYQEEYEKGKEMMACLEDDYEILQAYIEQMNIAHQSLTRKMPVIENITFQQIDYKTIEVSWDDSPYADEYEVYLKKPSMNQFVLYQTMTNNKVQLNVKMGKTYNVYVRGMNVDGVGEECEPLACMTQFTTRPSLKGSNISKTRFHLEWTAVEGATRYIIYCAPPRGAWKKVLTLKGDIFEYDTSSKVAGEYDYQVRAARYDSTDRVMSKKSNQVTLESKFSKPKVQVKTSKPTIKLSWEAVEGVTHYNIYIKENDAYTKIKTTKQCSYAYKEAHEKKTYYFKVEGYRNYNGYKYYSKAAECKVVIK